MGDTIGEVILLAILMLFFALVVGTFDEDYSYDILPLSYQQDNIFNKWRRIY